MRSYDQIDFHFKIYSHFLQCFTGSGKCSGVMAPGFSVEDLGSIPNVTKDPVIACDVSAPKICVSESLVVGRS